MELFIVLQMNFLKFPGLFHHVDWQIVAYVWELLTFPRNVGIRQSRRLKIQKACVFNKYKSARCGNRVPAAVHLACYKSCFSADIYINPRGYRPSVMSQADQKLAMLYSVCKSQGRYNAKWTKKMLLSLLNKKEYGTYSRNVMILYVAETK
jgi:hypothetical protein